MPPSSGTSEPDAPRPSRTPGWEPRDPSLPDPRRAPKSPKPPKRSRPRRFLRALLGLFLFGSLLLVGAFAAGYLLVEIPPANTAAVAQSNVYLYRDGSTLARDGEVNRENVRLDRVPLSLRQAVLAAEDRDFHTSRAVDPKAMLRAAWNTVTGKGRQSGSTITQQYVKNYYLGQEQTLSRKAKEFFIAIKLGREKSKEEILQGYLNTSYFGRNAYGVQAAARAYYGKDVEQLDTAEGAYLATLLKAPSSYDVTTHPENLATAVARWNYVLDGMVGEGWLAPADRAAVHFPAPQTARPATGLSGQRGYLVQAVEEYLTGRGIVDEKTLAGGGFRITTTLEPGKQEALVRAVEEQVMSRLDPGRSPADRNVRVGAAAVDPADGEVLAMYGGIDYTRQYVNNATRRDYQVGSTFKPFVFTAAVQSGAQNQRGEPITPYTVYDGSNRRPVEGWSGSPYDPANEDDASYGEIAVGAATDLSVNAVYAQMAVDVGPGHVRRTAVALGLPASTPDLTASPSIALGPATASVLDMATAYATLAAHGRHGSYTLVGRISRDGQELAVPAAAGRQVVSREAADTTTSILRSVVEAGTGTAAQAAGRPAAGKTGTAEDDRAAWFAGYTPELATVVALMGQDPESGRQESLYGALGLPRINGGGAPAEIWGRFTREALAGTAPRDFELQLMPGAEAMPAVPPMPDGPENPGGSAESNLTGEAGPGAAPRGPRPSRTPVRGQ
ncbi:MULTISPECIES: transglycosylase domain-containing protein [unclassified Streptomyces]|uniref:transglycosylase domain-containing protein n=1 Tax=unclassified Streptomyces TaxID=2593676 RepID=UPI0006FCC601|nr:MULTISPECIES: transglycosylase domain-containing protein [unclassified Streptomyces]KQX52748.1 penicillin-binding protein [Streptomyces sp. Root1304]KRA89663.1 penicillin-binding protein [Streptomyces sp. Root66D1]